MSTIRADDGSRLEVKEGVVLDKEGQVISDPIGAGSHEYGRQGPFGRSYVVSHKFGPLSAILFLLALPLLFTAGVTVVLIVIAVFFVLWLLGRLMRLFF